MAERWGEYLEGEAQSLDGHLTFERVTAARSGEEITVHFTSDILVEERPFLAFRRALRRQFAPMKVHLIIKSPKLCDSLMEDPMQYCAFILRSIKRHHPSCAPLLENARFEIKGDVLSVLVTQVIAPKFLVQSGVGKYIEQLLFDV